MTDINHLIVAELKELGAEIEQLENQLARVRNADIEQIVQFIRNHAYVDKVGGPYHAAQKIIDYFNRRIDDR